MRDKPELYYFAQPFAFGSGIRLVEDVNGPKMYETSLHGNHDMGSGRINNVMTSSSNVMSNFNMITPAPAEDNSFGDDSKYLGIEKDYNPFEEFDQQEKEIEIQKSPVVVPFTFVKKPDNIPDINDLTSALK